MPIAVGLTVRVPLGTGVAVFLHRCTPSGGSGSRTIGVIIGTDMTAFLHGHAPDGSVILPCILHMPSPRGERAPSQRLPGGKNLLNNVRHFRGTKGFRQPADASLLKEVQRLTGD